MPRASEANKLVSVSATSTSLTVTREKTIETPKAVEISKAMETAKTGKDGKKSKNEYPENLTRVLCIHYPINFGKKSMSALFDLASKVNAVHPAFAKKLGLLIRPTNVRAQKINGTTLNNFGIVVVVFSVTDKANQVRFFEETFLVANVSPEIVFGMLFLILSSADVDFLGWELRWRTYTTKKDLLTIRRIELVGKKKFAAAALDPEHETYIVHVGSVNSDALLSFFLLHVHPSRRSKISGLIVEEACTKIFAKYLDFANVFSLDLASKLPEYTGINNHAIEPVDGCQQLPYRSIYSLGPVELETLKAYIKTNLINGFIRSSKSPSGVLILFD